MTDALICALMFVGLVAGFEAASIIAALLVGLVFRWIDRRKERDR